MKEKMLIVERGLWLGKFIIVMGILFFYLLKIIPENFVLKIFLASVVWTICCSLIADYGKVPLTKIMTWGIDKTRDMQLPRICFFLGGMVLATIAIPIITYAAKKPRQTTLGVFSCHNLHFTKSTL